MREINPVRVVFILEEKVPTPWEELVKGELETEGVWEDREEGPVDLLPPPVVALGGEVGEGQEE